MDREAYWEQWRRHPWFVVHRTEDDDWIGFDESHIKQLRGEQMVALSMAKSFNCFIRID